MIQNRFKINLTNTLVKGNFYLNTRVKKQLKMDINNLASINDPITTQNNLK